MSGSTTGEEPHGIGASPSRVLFVSSLWPPVVLGGAETYAARLAERLRASGHTVGVVTLGVEGADVVASVAPWPYRLEQFARQSAARRGVFHLGDLYRPATARTLSRAIEEFGPDVVHTHSVQGLSSVALAIPTRRGVAHVHTIHDYWLLCQRASLVRRSNESCESRCVSCSAISHVREVIVRRSPPQVVLAVSDAVAREHRVLAWTRDRTRVLYNPIEEPVPAPDPHRVPRPGGALTFGYLGQLSPVKGVLTLVAAFRRAALPSGSRLVIGGDGPMRAELTAAAAGLDVELRGWLDAEAKRAFFAEIDALVVPSEWKDPAPLVVNEAIAHGVPVLGARIGGIPELVAPSCRPLLFASRDAGALGGRLEAFAASPGAFGSERPPGATTWDSHLTGVVAAYRDARARVTAGVAP